MWELQRYVWSNLRAEGTAQAIPSAICSLRDASTIEKADYAYWRIDNTVVVQGRLFEAALPTAVCLLAALQECTPIAQPFILELLVQIGAGEASAIELEKGNTALADNCIQELSRGTAMFFRLLETGTIEEKIHCIDLLGLCSLRDTALSERYHWYLRRLSTIPGASQGLKELIKNWLDDDQL